MKESILILIKDPDITLHVAKADIGIKNQHSKTVRQTRGTRKILNISHQFAQLLTYWLFIQVIWFKLICMIDQIINISGKICAWVFVVLN